MRWLVSFVVLVGCSAEYNVRIRASEDLVETSLHAEVAIIANCLSQTAAGPVSGDPHLFYELRGEAPPLGRVPEGNHGLFARFTDDACNVRAVGCEEVEIEDGGDATLVVNMSAASGFACGAAEQCVSGRCVSTAPGDAAVEREAGPVDSGPVDSGLADSGPVDSGLADSGDASSGDSGPSDAASDTSADSGLDPCLSALLCDDFEDDVFLYDISLEGESTVTQSRAEAHGGSQSVLIHATAGTVSTTFLTQPFDRMETGDRWVRAWYLFPESFGGISPFSFESGTNAITIFTTGEDFTVLETYLFPGAKTTVETRVALPNGRWACVEMHIDFDGPHTVELFIDGAPAAELDIPLPNPFPNVRFGAAYRDETDPEDYDIYVDDIGMSTERLGCN